MEKKFHAVLVRDTDLSQPLWWPAVANRQSFIVWKAEKPCPLEAAAKMAENNARELNEASPLVRT